jgi:L-seryl-tRNA(Ser) seleniumtransferase
VFGNAANGRRLLKKMNDPRRIPAVDSILLLPEFQKLRKEYGKTQVTLVLRSTLAENRSAMLGGDGDFSIESITQQVCSKLVHDNRHTLCPVINATGVILHTNLGRAPLSQETIQAVLSASSTYSNLEFDLENGARGSRSVHARGLLTQLTGSEDAFVVNNNAAAVLLILTALAKRKIVVISRSQLVEIGGGFRVPDVMKQSGAKLEEVGTTNRVKLSDYEESLTGGAEFVMRAHSSNFKIIGFTETPLLEDLTELTHRYGKVFIDDLGSGALIDTSQFGLAKEPMVQDSIRAGADLVCFSGDKLLGGPQAGIIVGKKDLISSLKKHPLARALRADKLCLAGLTATLLHYQKGEELSKIPIWKMVASPLDYIQERANKWQQTLGFGEVISEFSTIGGGSLPEEMLPTYVLALTPRSPERFSNHLRQASPPIVARINSGRVLFDPRTVFEEDDDILLAQISKSFGGAIYES